MKATHEGSSTWGFTALHVPSWWPFDEHVTRPSCETASLDWRQMTISSEAIEAPLSPAELARRWQDLAADQTFEDVAGKIELPEWGEILMTPVGKSHGLAAMRLGERLCAALGKHTMTEVGVATSIGVRAPDVAWCSDAWLAAHPEELPLSAAPELCIKIVSVPKLREKAVAYVNADAREAWLVYPSSRRVEIYSPSGRAATTAFPIDLTTLFA